ncbi:hypothetical protein BKN38_01435 [Helicobacter sp. CLO-3]|uniref:hypothetical protein n=1 Tax=unclassified Helicobacter TaxID=2593540 RepID=UPI0008054ECD|nr:MULTISPECIES: hypothetical protein [unclassified Helicobacter]OBV29771.1 hypothetical protein BA723_00240 [Helicobacter sp. CLO-3]OHU85224.1 hypothetical protein BKN38_01435 [Helicobacter sp. CLO-3]
MRLTKLTRLMRFIESTKPINSIKSMQPIKSMRLIKSIKPAESTAPIKSAKKAAFLLLSLMLATNLCALDAERESRNNKLGNWWQIATFHIGSSIDINTPNGGAMGLNIGGSAGWNYIFLSDVDMGARFKYLYSNAYASTHSLGAMLYIHTANDDMFSLALGGGVLFTNQGGQSATGSYVEVGVGLFKFFPVNGDLLYRASFYPASNPLGMSEMVHGIQIVFSLF